MARRLIFPIVCAGACGLLLGSIAASRGRQTTVEPDAKSVERDEAGRRDHDWSPPRGRALEPMTRRVLIRRSLETFPAGYLTLIGIIQGVALGILVEQVHPLILGAAVLGDRAVALGEFFMAFTTILVVSYEYLWFTTIMRWTPTATDTLVPHTLGVCEIAPLFLLERPVAWWISTACMGCAGALALAHTLMRCTREAFDSHGEVFIRIRALLKQQITICLVWSTAGAAAAVAFTGRNALGALPAVLPWVFASAGVVMVRIAERALDFVYEAYGLPRGDQLASDRHRVPAGQGAAEEPATAPAATLAPHAAGSS